MMPLASTAAPARPLYQELKARLHRGKEFLKRRIAAAGILHGGTQGQ